MTTDTPSPASIPEDVREAALDVANAALPECGLDPSWTQHRYVADAIARAILADRARQAAGVDAVLMAGKPFGYDPATGFFHADDGGAGEHCVFFDPRDCAALAEIARLTKERDDLATWKAEIEAASHDWMEQTGQSYCYVGIRDYAAVKADRDEDRRKLAMAREALENARAIYWSDDASDVSTAMFEVCNAALNAIKEAST